jgi:elongation factor P--beta-lysine ligase
MNLQPLFIRETVIKAVREFFDTQGFHEIIVPVLNRSLPLEPTLYSFSTTWQARAASETLYLTISPESGLKKMIAKGVGNCYAIGKCFRNLEGRGPRHNPEFLMLEWYREDARYNQIMSDTETLVRFVKNKVFAAHQRHGALGYQHQIINVDTPWQRLSLEQLCHDHLGKSIEEFSDEKKLLNFMRERGYNTKNGTWEQLFDQLMLNEIEPYFPKNPFFLLDFPAKLSPLCSVNPAKPYLAERFECFMAGMEIGNGNNENTDAEAVRWCFKLEDRERKQRGETSHPIDSEFIAALEKMDAKQYAGIGLGIDRLAMIMADVTSIDEIEPFCLTTTD